MAALPVGLLVLLVLVLVLLYLAFRTNSVRVEANQKGALAPILTRMSSLKKPYSPTPWLLGGLPQTVYGMRYRKRSRLLGTEQRTEIDLFDGGTLALDFFTPATVAPDAPFVIVLPTVGGSTWEPCTNTFVETIYRKGWPSAVMNGRGFAGLKLKTPRFGCAIDFEDVRDTVAYIREHYNPTHLFLVGFSMGSMQAVAYTMTDAPAVDGIAVVSHSYDCEASACLIERGIRKKLLTPSIMRSVYRTMDKNPFSTEAEKAACRRCRSLHEFDERFTAPSRGFPDSRSYYRELSLEKNIPKIKVPTLVLGAENDPFIKPGSLPAKAARESENVAVVHVKEGGHVSFLTGWAGKKSLTDLIVPDWIEAVTANKLSGR